MINPFLVPQRFRRLEVCKRRAPGPGLA